LSEIESRPHPEINASSACLVNDRSRNQRCLTQLRAFDKVVQIVQAGYQDNARYGWIVCGNEAGNDSTATDSLDDDFGGSNQPLAFQLLDNTRNSMLRECPAEIRRSC
jgi:hypothetical protein